MYKVLTRAITMCDGTHSKIIRGPSKTSHVWGQTRPVTLTVNVKIFIISIITDICLLSLLWPTISITELTELFVYQCHLGLCNSEGKINETAS